MNKDSHTISKLKPKIRIIHIVAPEIIKTDAENFRDLVQRLTGKQAKVSRGRSSKSTTRKASSNCSKKLWTNNSIHHQLQDHQYHHHHHRQGMKRDIMEEEYDEYRGGEGGEKSNSSCSNYGVFGNFGEVVDDHMNFIQDLSEYPNLLPFKSSQMNNMFGHHEMHIL